MNEERDKDYLASIDRRVTDHDNKLAMTQRDYTELSHEIKELMNRINNGISPSVNEVRKENAAITLSIAELSHELKLTTMDVRSVVRESAEHTRLMIQNFEEHKLKPIESEVGFMKKTFIYGVVGAIIVVLGQLGINTIIKKFFSSEKPALTEQTK